MFLSIIYVAYVAQARDRLFEACCKCYNAWFWCMGHEKKRRKESYSASANPCVCISVVIVQGQPYLYAIFYRFAAVLEIFTAYSWLHSISFGSYTWHTHTSQIFVFDQNSKHACHNNLGCTCSCVSQFCQDTQRLHGD